MPPSKIQVAKEVAEALAARKAVVALESTLITHGLPFPINAETALAMEAAVRESGAVPATIAVLGGMITVGVSAGDIRRLAQLPRDSVRKCSRKDLPIAVALGEDASTTVAATLHVAHLAGISVLATGGIGGVHRGDPFDVSADLLELGHTPVAVVCSGAKAILDLPRTVEVLETQGVAVLGFGTSTLPGFYTRSTGLPVDVTVQSPEEAARIIASARRLGTRQGLLVAVPVPEADALPQDEVEKAVASALSEAAARGIRGKSVTPFLLERVAEISGGRSRRANVSLLVNNARVAGLIASALIGMDGP
ncbi:MAG: pseudouridine-5'-phosphate glycosidase [Opitutaceae bacterium]